VGRILRDKEIEVQNVAITTKGKATTGNESDVGLVGKSLDLQPTSLCLTEGEKGFKAAVGDSVRDCDSRGTAMLIVTKNTCHTF
jgi:hypothetical protein